VQCGHIEHLNIVFNKATFQGNNWG